MTLTIRQRLEAIRDRNACVYLPESNDCAEGIDSGCDWCVNRRDAVAALKALDESERVYGKSVHPDHRRDFALVRDPAPPTRNT